MFNKIVLKNGGAPFKVIFDGKEYNVPAGEFESEAVLGNFVLTKAVTWGLDVKLVTAPVEPSITQARESSIVSTEKEEIKDEEPKEAIPTKAEKATKAK